MLPKRRFKYHCNVCGYEDWRSNMINGCRLCTNQVIVKGVNDIATTDSWMTKFLKNKDDAYKYSKNSHTKVEVVCPDCGNTKMVDLYNLYKTKKVACPCQDGWSYPRECW